MKGARRNIMPALGSSRKPVVSGGLLTRVPGGIAQPVAETRQHVDHDEDGVRRVLRSDHVRDDVAPGTEGGDAALAKLLVEGVVENGRSTVPNKGRQEDERDEGVLKPVVGAEVGDDGAVGSVVHAHDEQRPEGGEDAADVRSRLVPSLDGV